jgi:hypothetical protein
VLVAKTKSMKELEMHKDNCGGDKCPDCERQQQEVREAEESNLAVLVSLVPLLVLTFFSQIGML